jgi:hypothetical protein
MNVKNIPAILLLVSALSFFGCHKVEVSQNIPSATNLPPVTDSPFAASATLGIPLKNMFGINGYEWNFLQDPANPSDGSKIYAPKMAVIRDFAAFRHYMDWGQIEQQQGEYTFNPVFSGNWNYDVMYQQSATDTIMMLADLKTCPQWLVNSYPANLQNSQNVPAPYGLNRSDPASYTLQAKAAFQLAARYGSNTKVPKSLVTVDSKPRWTADPPNQVKIGLNILKYIECDNERDKWWLGPQAEQSPQEYAANMSAFYDGNKGKLGKNVGVKTADPNMQVVMGGLANPSVQYVTDMIAWCKTNRGYRADGSIDLCFDVINYHKYSNDGGLGITGKAATVGVAPELSGIGAIADGFIKLSASLPNHPPVWITENGYDINASSPQRAIQIGNKSALLTQGDWIIRSCLLYIRHGIARLFFYQLFDDTPNGSGTYQTSGLINQDLTRRPAADYILQVKNLMGNYTYNSTINTDPLVDKYVSANKTMYVLTIPDEKGRTGTYVLNLGSSANAAIYSLKAGANAAIKTIVKTNKGKLTVNVTETPVFVESL